jgi:hypothetical protein
MLSLESSFIKNTVLVLRKPFIRMSYHTAIVINATADATSIPKLDFSTNVGTEEGSEENTS